MNDITQRQLRFLKCVAPRPGDYYAQCEAHHVASRWNAQKGTVALFGRVSVGAARSRLRRLADRGLVEPQFNGPATRWVLTSDGRDVVEANT